jgi:hypothetical protein
MSIETVALVVIGATLFAGCATPARHVRVDYLQECLEFADANSPLRASRSDPAARATVHVLREPETFWVLFQLCMQAKTGLDRLSE